MYKYIIYLISNININKFQYYQIPTFEFPFRRARTTQRELAILPTHSEKKRTRTIPFPGRVPSIPCDKSRATHKLACGQHVLDSSEILLRFCKLLLVIVWSSVEDVSEDERQDKINLMLFDKQ